MPCGCGRLRSMAMGSAAAWRGRIGRRSSATEAFCMTGWGSALTGPAHGCQWSIFSGGRGSRWALFDLEVDCIRPCGSASDCMALKRRSSRAKAIRWSAPQLTRTAPLAPKCTRSSNPQLSRTARFATACSAAPVPHAIDSRLADGPRFTLTFRTLQEGSPAGASKLVHPVALTNRGCGLFIPRRVLSLHSGAARCVR